MVLRTVIVGKEIDIISIDELINNNRCNLAKQTLVVIKHKKYNKHLQNYVINVKN